MISSLAYLQLWGDRHGPLHHHHPQYHHPHQYHYHRHHRSHLWHICSSEGNAAQLHTPGCCSLVDLSIVIVIVMINIFIILISISIIIIILLVSDESCLSCDPLTCRPLLCHRLIQAKNYLEIITEFATDQNCHQVRHWSKLSHNYHRHRLI